MIHLARDKGTAAGERCKCSNDPARSSVGGEYGQMMCILRVIITLQVWGNKGAVNTKYNLFKISFYFKIHDMFRLIIRWYTITYKHNTTVHHQGVRPDGEGSAHLWNVGLFQRDYTAVYLREMSSLKI
jgi:hypothetical protein